MALSASGKTFRKMPWPLPKHRNEWLLFFAGAGLMMLQFILVQHTVVAIRHDEVAVFIFSLAFFTGISLGYLLSGSVTVAVVRRLLPVFLITQLSLILLMQPAVYFLTRDAGRWIAEHGVDDAYGLWFAYACIFTWITLGAASLYAIFLPSIIEEEEGRLRRCYSIEILGSLTGLLLIPLLTIVSHTALLSAYCACFIVIAVLVKSSRISLIAMSVVVMLFVSSYHFLDQQVAGWFYKQRYRSSDVEGVAYTRHTAYHKIEVLALDDDEYMLLLNGKRQFAKGSHYTYSYFTAEYPARLLDEPTVCLLGCGSMSTVGRIGELSPSITIVDLDEAVFAISRRFFQKYNRLDELDNWTFFADDAKHFLANRPEKYDLILHDIPPARSRQTALTYTAEFFAIVKEHLTSRGMFSIAALNSGSGSGYGQKMLATLAYTFDHYFVISYRDSYYFFGGGTGMDELNKSAIRSAINHSGSGKVRVLNRHDVDRLVGRAKIITTNNVGDLIFD